MTHLTGILWRATARDDDRPLRNQDADPSHMGTGHGDTGPFSFEVTRQK